MPVFDSAGHLRDRRKCETVIPMFWLWRSTAARTAQLMRSIAPSWQAAHPCDGDRPAGSLLDTHQSSQEKLSVISQFLMLLSIEML
jgi:hypothetical protein